MRGVTEELSEDRLIAAIGDALGKQPRKLRVGIGDDAAVWKPGHSHLLLATTDALVDGVHFILSDTTPQALGHKALAVNLSDIAAMGGVPVLAVIALGVTDVVDERWAREFYHGLGALARRYACAVAGGDIVRSPTLLVAVTVVGEVRRSNLRLRSGARPGDVACVTGPLGLAAVGLRLLTARHSTTNVGGDCKVAPAEAAVLRAAYETPTPRLLEGKFLGAARSVHAMMDISDGLSLDISRMARASGVDVCIDLDRLRELCTSGPLGPLYTALELALHGGDDYELLAAVGPRAYAHLAARFKTRFDRKLAFVGRFEAGAGKVWISENGERREHIPRGYDHLNPTV